MAPGPDGGLYVLIDAPRELIKGPPSRAVLALLDSTGKPRPGWPVQLIGWSCGDPNAAYGAFSAAADGSTRLVCTQDVDGEATARSAAFAFDSAGRSLPGWPVELTAGSASDPWRVVGDDLLILTSEFAAADNQTPAGVWRVVDVAVDGTVRSGLRYEVSGAGRAGMGPDGAAYLLAMAESNSAITTEVVALGVDGVRAGWPQTVGGWLSNPTIGPGGRVYVTQVQRTGTATRSRTLVFESDGGSVAAGSDSLAMAALDDYTGAGARPMPPTVATDGTVFIVGAANGHLAAYAIDPAGMPIGGWPYRLPAGLQTQGSCGQSAGCGVWQTTPAVGPDDTLYLLVAASDKKSGGSIVAVGIDGRVRLGWPVRLPAAGAGFWSVTVGSDGTVYAVAVEPSASRNSWTVFAIDPNGAVRARTQIVAP